MKPPPWQLIQSIRGPQRIAANGLNDRFAFICLIWLFVPVLLCSVFRPAVWANDVEVGDTVTIVTPGIEARLCPQPGCGPDQHITRIPEGTVLPILGIDIFAIGTFKVKWFEVVYDNQRGWISIYDTNRAGK